LLQSIASGDNHDFGGIDPRKLQLSNCPFIVLDTGMSIPPMASGQAFEITVYLVEKFTGLYDEKGVEMFYTVAVKLTRDAADGMVKHMPRGSRVRKLTATKAYP
jgi:hypothetical protein